MDPDSCCDEILDFSKYLPVAYPEKLMCAGLKETEAEKEKEKTAEADIKEAAEVEKEERVAKEKSKADKVAEIKKNQEANKAGKEENARRQLVSAEKKIGGLSLEGVEKLSRWERQKMDRDTKEGATGVRLRSLDLREEEEIRET